MLINDTINHSHERNLCFTENEQVVVNDRMHYCMNISSLKYINFLCLVSYIFNILVMVIADGFYECQIKSYAPCGRDAFVNFNSIFPSM